MPEFADLPLLILLSLVSALLGALAVRRRCDPARTLAGVHEAALVCTAAGDVLQTTPALHAFFPSGNTGERGRVQDLFARLQAQGDLDEAQYAEIVENLCHRHVSRLAFSLDGRHIDARQFLLPGGEYLHVYSEAAELVRLREGLAGSERGRRTLQSLLEMAPSAIFIFSLDDDGMLFANRRARDMIGAPGPHAAGIARAEVFFDPADRAWLIEAVRSERTVKDRELQLYSGPDEIRWFHVSATLIEYEGQQAMFCAMLDIDARRQAELQLRLARAEAEMANRELRAMNLELEQLASTDRLTRAFNRRHFEEVALREMSRARRYGLPLALIIVDLDHFKRINDEFGHAAGDRVLVEFAQIARQKLRSSDMLARWGGEEFVILATSSALEEAETLAEKLRELLAEHHIDEVQRVTLSAGVTDLSPKDTLDSFIRRADTALYQAKSEGRNRVVAVPHEVFVH